MPRPDGGYRNQAGDQVPGVHDITNAFCPKPALVHWAYNQGRKGVPLYERSTLDIGSAVHAMAELNLKGRPSREIEERCHEVLREPGDLAKAWAAYSAFEAWRDACAVRSIAHEVTLVSETYQLGGTPDCVALIEGEPALIDLKTCSSAPTRPYEEQLLVMAAHAELWNERHPDQAITSCHIIYLPKDGKQPKHHSIADYAPQWQVFSHLLTAFQVKHGTPQASIGRADFNPTDAAAMAAKDAEIARLTAELAARRTKTSRPRTVRPAPKLRLAEPVAAPVLAAHAEPVVVLPPPPRPATMAELLRSYGHVKG